MAKAGTMFTPWRAYGKSELYFCCLSFLCTRVRLCCIHVVSYYTRVASCCTRVVTRVVFQTRSTKTRPTSFHKKHNLLSETMSTDVNKDLKTNMLTVNSFVKAGTELNYPITSQLPDFISILGDSLHKRAVEGCMILNNSISSICLRFDVRAKL